MHGKTVEERTIGALRRRPVVALVPALVAAVAVALIASPAAFAGAGGKVWVLGPGGRAHAEHDRFLPSRAYDLPAPRGRAAARGPVARTAAVRRTIAAQAGAPRGTVQSVLGALRDRGEIDPLDARAWRKVWDDSYRALKSLSGTRRTQLYAVRENVAILARDGLLTPTRAPLAFLTLERNLQWWPKGRLLAYGERVEFPPSELVWQMYPGQGLQLQWLGTFGKANGLWGARENERLRTLLDEAIALGASRAGGIGFEYMFAFGGGRPPWVSGMAQATGLQAFARAASRLKEPAYFDAGRRALGVFRQRPPGGVRVATGTGTGAHYLIYSFAPGSRVLNAFAQTLDGLHDFARLSENAAVRTLFEDGEGDLRATLRRYDTGAWSLYELGGSEADLNYHTIARDFVGGLCDRLGSDGENGVAGPGPLLYCKAARRFTGYLLQAPRVRVYGGTGRKGVRRNVRFTLSKVSTVTVTMTRGSAVAYRAVWRLSRGPHSVSIVPQKRGPLKIDVRAVDLAGNAAEASNTLRVKPAPKKPKKKKR
jgi:hypothetical protein